MRFLFLTARILKWRRKQFAGNVFWGAVLLALFPTQGLLGQSSLKISGELRMRAEGRDNADFNSERLDGKLFVLNRFRLGIEKNMRRNISVFAQVQDSRIWGEEGSSLGALENLDLHQAYLDIQRLFGAQISARLGRQILDFGSGRFVGRTDWHNVGRAFGAANFQFGRRKQTLNIWLAHLRDQNAPTIMRNQEFGGAYFSKKTRRNDLFEAFALFFYDGRNYDALTDLDVPIDRSEETSSHLAVWTLGGRLKQQLFRRFTFEAEGARQLGNRGPIDVRAYTLAFETRLQLHKKRRFELMAGYTLGSGDDPATIEKRETFLTLFPTGHQFLGVMDYAGMSNIASFHAGLRFCPAKNWIIGAKFYWLDLATDEDHWYRAAGYQIGSPAEIYRRAVAGAGRNLGGELDLFLEHRFRGQIDVKAGLSQLFVGEFIENTGGLRADNSYWGYFSLTTRF